MVFTNLTTIVPNLRYGFHIEKKSTLEETFKAVENTPLKSYQIYVANSRSYTPANIPCLDLRVTKSYLQRRDTHPNALFIHSSLLHNIAGQTNGEADPKFKSGFDNTLRGLIAELDIASLIGASVVVHCGSSKNTQRGEQIAGGLLAKALQEDGVYTARYSKELQIPVEEIKKGRKILLENSAGEGSKLGNTLEGVARIIKESTPETTPELSIPLTNGIGVCIDTCHMYGSGQFDFGKKSDVTRFFKETDELLHGKLKVFHLNDSNEKFGSKKDRHACLKKGYIFGAVGDDADKEDALLELLLQAAARDVSLVGETASAFWDYDVVCHVCGAQGGFECC